MLRIGRDLLSVGILALLMSPAQLSGQSPKAQMLPKDDAVIRLSSLQRSIRVFDFEEAAERPVEFPDHFYRRSPRDGALAEGFPPFGTIRLANDQAFSGQWSFKFELDGGSLAARTFAGALPVLPHADYAVAAKVRTRGLNFARARLVAWLTDRQGRPIDASRSESPLLRSGNAWETVSVEVYGEYDDVADLVVELQVLQPDQFTSVDADLDEPRREDLSGIVWFDQVRVLHLPRIELDAIGEGIVSSLPAIPQLNLLVRDLASEPIISHLEVFDLDGNRVFDGNYGPARGQQRHTVSIPLDRAGWYRAKLDVHSGPRLIGQRQLDFAVLAPSNTIRVRSRNRFAVVIPDPTPSQLNVLPSLISDLDVGHAVLPVWTRGFAATGHTTRMQHLHRIIAELLRSDVELTLSLNEIPDELARDAGLDHDQVLELFQQDAARWKPYLEELLVTFGLDIRRWQMGATGRGDLVRRADASALARDAERALERYVADVDLLVPWAAEYELAPGATFGVVHAAIPFEAPPFTIDTYVNQLRTGAGQVTALLERLPSDRYSPRQAVNDLMRRALYAWRSDATLLSLQAPWSWEAGPHDRLMIDPAFVAWRTLADRLSDRRFVGTLPAGDNVHVWILEGRASNDAALVVWSDRISPAGPEAQRWFLGHEPVLGVDAFGNTFEVPLDGSEHVIVPDELPRFIEHINLELAKFRASFSLNPNMVLSMNRVHEHMVELLNPWNMTISGEIKLADTDDLDISPRTLPFTIRPGATARLPVQIRVGRNVLAGQKSILASASINADREYNVELQTTTTVGLPDVAFSASWGHAENVVTGDRELVVTQRVTNVGESILNLDVFVMAPDRSVRRRRLPPLGPGETAIRLFNLGHGDAILGARDVRVGLEEWNGSVRLNQLLAIPVSSTPQTAGVAPP
jgi:hypothetical protein